MTESLTNQEEDKDKQIQQKYSADADMMATKSRFGFFNIYPSHTAAITDYAQKTGKSFDYPTAQKDDNGKVKTSERGIFSGIKPSKVLNKTFFSEIQSPFVGCPYEDPGRA